MKLNITMKLTLLLLLLVQQYKSDDIESTLHYVKYGFLQGNDLTKGDINAWFNYLRNYDRLDEDTFRSKPLVQADREKVHTPGKKFVPLWHSDEGMILNIIL
jgi:hypothetical protein